MRVNLLAFEGFGKVVLNMIDYQKSCYELIFNVFYMFLIGKSQNLE
jgi:hypothetical protein